MIIIGSGLAAYTLVREFRKLNQAPITVITKNEGAYYSKPQLSSVLSLKKTPAQLILKTGKAYAEQLNFTLLAHTQVFKVDTEAQLCFTARQALPYSSLVFATGARPQRTNFSQVLTVNNLDDYRKFYERLQGKRNIAILGSGLVGCELANDLITAGYEVRLISRQTYPLASLVPEFIGRSLEHAFAEQGVQFHWQSELLELGTDAGDYQLKLNNQQILAADLILSAWGLRPDTQLAEEAGLQVEEGIKVNEFLATSAKHCYALGDCANYKGYGPLGYVAPLALAARILAKNLNGEKMNLRFPVMPIYVKTPVYPVVIATLPGAKNLHWQPDKTHPHDLALSLDRHDVLQGFILGGKTTALANDWLARLNA